MTELPYRRMSIAAKQAAHRERMREPAITCPFCEVQTTVVELLRHVETTCPGHRPAHPLSKWVTWSDVLELGVRKQTMHDWVRKGLVQVDGPFGKRRYLLRDVVRLLARRLVRKTGLDTGKHQEIPE